jgi:putative transposase
MRKPRIILNGRTAIYHCMSRSAGGQFIFRHEEKTVFMHQMRKVARFCGIKILNFSVMGNHYHQVIKVPGKVRLSDEQLRLRVRKYYGERSPEYRSLKRALAGGAEELRTIRAKFLRMMGNVSVFQKLLKQRFSIWYNGRHNRCGTLWMGRFKSVLIENSPFAKMCVSAYVDLNAVRAGIVKEPKEYRFCGYSLALLGDKSAQSGLCQVVEIGEWREAIEAYTQFMLDQGTKKGRGRFSISRELLLKRLEEGDSLAVPELIKLRLRFFSDGMAIGREAFLQALVSDMGTQDRSSSSGDFEKLVGGDWHSLRALQRFRKPVIS